MYPIRNWIGWNTLYALEKSDLPGMIGMSELSHTLLNGGLTSLNSFGDRFSQNIARAKLEQYINLSPEQRARKQHAVVSTATSNP